MKYGENCIVWFVNTKYPQDNVLLLVPPTTPLPVTSPKPTTPTTPTQGPTTPNSSGRQTTQTTPSTASFLSFFPSVQPSFLGLSLMSQPPINQSVSSLKNSATQLSNKWPDLPRSQIPVPYCVLTLRDCVFYWWVIKKGCMHKR